jgi:hypothetical protein
MRAIVENNSNFAISCRECCKVLKTGETFIVDYPHTYNYETSFFHCSCYENEMKRKKNEKEIEIVKKGELEIVQVVNLGKCKTTVDLTTVPKKVHVPTIVDMEI